ncbi:MAG: DUF4397 domain-containing protein [Myxococcales bacterium]|nr:DUF4397 domain-containing protein [Myxococcales bacterium]MCB9532744.1 DUF4397 domain-containing protein [Myxococcales bacterium]
MRRGWLFAVAVVAGVAACSDDPSKKDDACTTNADCLVGFDALVCVNGACVAADDAGGDGGDVSDAGGDIPDGEADACSGAGCDASDGGDAGADVYIPDPIVTEPGACTNGPDMLAIHRRDPQVCGDCVTNDDPTACVGECLEALSPECRGCYADFMQCVHDSCEAVCTQLDEACWACGQASCTAVAECAGRATLPPFEECTSDADRTSVAEHPDELVLQGAECMASCDGTSEECANSGECGAPSGLSDGCYQCFLQRGECTRELCFDDCTDADSQECENCRLHGCSDQMSICTGLDFAEGSGSEGSGSEGSGSEGSGSEGSGSEGSGSEPTEAFVAVVHLSPDNNGIAAYVHGQPRPFVGELGYGNASGAQIVPAGTTQIDLLASGSPAGSEPLATAVLPSATSVGTVITVALYGQGSAVPSTLSTVSRVEEGVDSGVRWRLFNGAPAFASVDLYDTTTGGATRAGASVAFGQFAAAATRSAGDFRLGVDTDGNGSPDYEFDVGPYLDASDATLWLGSDLSATPFIIRTLSTGIYTRVNPRSAD